METATAAASVSMVFQQIFKKRREGYKDMRHLFRKACERDCFVEMLRINIIRVIYRFRYGARISRLKF